MTTYGRKGSRLPRWRRLGWRLGASLLLLVALAILASGLLQYRAEARILRESLGGLLLNIARTGALLLDGDLHEAVVRDGRTDTEAYAAVRDRLARIQATNGLGDPVYTLSDVRGDMARFAVISHGQEPVGKEYRLAPAIQPILRQVLAAGTAAYTDVYTNEHGAWITAFAPVRNGAGRTVAALDVDYRADVYLAELAAARRRLYLHSLVGALLALGVGAALARRITGPLGQLAGTARRVVEGDLTATVRIAARDEIGMLGNVFALMIDRVRVSHRSMVDVLVRTLESRDGGFGALARLARAARAIAERLDLTPAQRESLELGALLHDLGEIRIPEALLHKPGPLDAGERRMLEQHPALGAAMLESVPLLTPALDVVAAHHERYDGTGYPGRLAAEAIPLTARIAAVADALDAMTHARPHRPPRPLAAALDEVRQQAGRQFDPRVVTATLAVPAGQWAEILGVPAADEPAAEGVKSSDAVAIRA
ncbi:MAG: HD domain-containing phosphohydrolase [Candidatus Methylomirabilales bacterium]